MRQPNALLSFVLFLSFSIPANAQSSRLPVYLNHVFFVLDSDSYAHVFDSVIFQKIGFAMVNKTTTTEGSWYGKYLMGRDSYFEVFYPTGLKGSSVGNFGFGFMTTTSGDIDQLESQWKANYKDSVKRDTNTVVNNGVKLPWFYSLSLYTVDSSKSGSAWVMENTPDMLKSAGFTDDEMKKAIFWHDFLEKKMKMKTTKSFNRIVAVEIITNKKELGYFKKSFHGFGLTEKNHTFSNENIHITYTLADIPASELKSVEIELTDSFKEQTIALSDKLSMHVKDKSATFFFTH
jgi:Family of unknown function (DUF5829)